MKNQRIAILFSIAILVLIIGKCFGQEIIRTNIVTDTNIVRYIPADSLNISPTLSHSLQELWDVTAGSTNGAVVMSAGRGLTGNKNFVAADYIYNLNQNAGLIFGYDYLFSNDKRMGAAQANILKGGLNLQAQLYPLKRFSTDTNSFAHNFHVTPFASVLIITPINGTSNNGGIGQATIAGADWESPLLFNKVHLHLGGYYENRTGQGAWDGNYAALHAAVSYGF